MSLHLDPLILYHGVNPGGGTLQCRVRWREGSWDYREDLPSESCLVLFSVC